MLSFSQAMKLTAVHVKLQKQSGPYLDSEVMSYVYFEGFNNEERITFYIQKM